MKKGQKFSEEHKKKLSEAKKGKKFSEEHKRKLSEVHRGQKHSEETKQKIRENNGSYWKGKKLSEETKRKMSESRKGRIHSEETRRKISKSHKDDKHYNWKGGISSINDRIRHGIDYQYWRSAIFGRDEYTCQKCGNNEGGNLNAHHIVNFATNEELRYAVSNGITLCKECHQKFHSIYGRKNNTREQLKQFL